MPSKYTKSWEAVRGEQPLDEQRVATYERLMEAEERIAVARCRRGESRAAIAEALAASELTSLEVEPEDNLYLRTLSRFVAALGGHLEVVAVFPEEAITVRREPGERYGSDPA